MLKSVGYKLFITLAFMLLSLIGVKAQDNGSQPNSNENDSRDSRVKQDPFVPTAVKLAQTLQTKVNLDDDQMGKIRDLLIAYNSKVRDLHGIQMAANRDNSVEQRAGAKSGKTKNAPKDNVGTNKSYGTSDSKEPNQSDIAQNLKENDIETNKDIEDVLNDNQRSAWLSEKSSWWKNVKDEVYSGKSSIDNNMNNNETGNMNDNHMRNGKGNSSGDHMMNGNEGTDRK